MRASTSPRRASVHRRVADRPAPRRQLVDHRDVEVGVVGHRERARDRRRAHHELVRRSASRCLAPQRRGAAARRSGAARRPPRARGARSPPLPGTARACRWRSAPRRWQWPRAPRASLASRGRRAARRCARPSGREPLAELAPVLLGEDLGRRHHRRLRARHRPRRGRRCAATMVLPLPTSPCSSRCIGCGSARSRRTSFIARALRAREPERQRCRRNALQQRAVGGQRRARAACGACGRRSASRAAARAARRTSRAATPGGCGRRARRASLPGGGRCSSRTLSANAAQPIRLAAAAAAACPRARRVSSACEDALAQRRLRQPGGRRVDRRQRLAAAARPRARCGSAGAPSRRRRSRRAPRRRRAPRSPSSAARWNCFSWLPVEVEEAQHQALRRAPPAGGAGGRRSRRARRAPRPAPACPAGASRGARERGLVLVAQRQVQHEVEARAQAELRELRLRTASPRVQDGVDLDQRAARQARPRRPRRAPDRARARTAP